MNLNFDLVDVVVDDLLTGNDVQIASSNRTFVTDAKEIITWYLVKNLTPQEIADTAAEIKRLDKEGE